MSLEVTVMRHSAGGSYVSVFWQIYGFHTMQGSETGYHQTRNQEASVPVVILLML